MRKLLNLAYIATENHTSVQVSETMVLDLIADITASKPVQPPFALLPLVLRRFVLAEYLRFGLLKFTQDGLLPRLGSIRTYVSGRPDYRHISSTCKRTLV